MTPNFLVLLGSAFIPMVVGMLWYNPKTFLNPWMKGAGLTEDEMKANQKPLKFLLGFICNFLLAFGLFTAVTHEFSILGLVGGDQELLKTGTAAAFLAEYGGSYARFSHGIVHGIVAAVAFALPLIGHQCLWSGKGWKYFFIDFGFWLVCMILMCGVIAQWGGTMVV